MVTSAQSDPRGDMLRHLTSQVPLDEAARSSLEQLIFNVDIGKLQSKADVANAMSSIDRLARHLYRRYSLNPGDAPYEVSADQVRMALRDLCPLFPIC